jgi:hypothetical protein
MEGLRRPFTEKQLRELLAETGEVTWFWINRIKSLAFAEFRTEKEADATRRALYDLQVRTSSLTRREPATVRRAVAAFTCRPAIKANPTPRRLQTSFAKLAKRPLRRPNRAISRTSPSAP